MISAGSYTGKLFGLTLDPSSLSFTPAFAFKPHQGCIYAISASPKRILATGSSDEKINVYDLSTLSVLGTLLDHEATVTALAFSSSVLLSADASGAACIWNASVSDFPAIAPFSRPSHGKRTISDLSIHPKGPVGLSVGEDCRVCVWDLDTGSNVHRIRLPGGLPARACAWRPTGEHFALIVGHALWVMSLERGIDDVQIKAQDHQGELKCLEWLSETLVAVGGDDQHVHVHDVRVEDDQAIMDGMAHGSRVRGIVSVGDRRLVTASSDGVIASWDLRRAEEPVSFQETLERLTCLTYCV